MASRRVMSGGPIDVSFVKDHPKISGVIWAGYPGQAGGLAFADVLFGQTNPGIFYGPIASPLYGPIDSPFYPVFLSCF